jgi:hypothetical protein
VIVSTSDSSINTANTVGFEDRILLRRRSFLRPHWHSACHMTTQLTKGLEVYVNTRTIFSSTHEMTSLLERDASQPRFLTRETETASDPPSKLRGGVDNFKGRRHFAEASQLFPRNTHYFCIGCRRVSGG